MSFNNSGKNILVAPLNWGLGHATRCIPIIRELKKNGYNPIIASDGIALDLLSKEFPDIICLELPSQNIKYSKKNACLKLNIIKNSPRIIKTFFSEKKLVQKWVSEYNLVGIISDNRLGVRNKKIKSVYITHQLNILSGNTTWISSKIHQFFIRKFDECWIPDFKNFPNFSGFLGHVNKVKSKKINLKYIGILSRFEKQNIPIIYDLMVVLSGPEPQRSLLEVKLITELKNYTGNVVFIKGIIEAHQTQEQVGNIIFYNFMQSNQLEKTLNESKLVVCRSGYSTIMDLAKLEKKAFFIPTPGQFEQEYLAKKFKQNGLIPYKKQDYFTKNDLNEGILYKGFSNFNSKIIWEDLFRFF
jgi:uncharacterized protein (TIGR00661 family)